MTEAQTPPPLARSLIRITGKDSADFLQGMLTNDVTHASPEHSLYTALLSPQGKFLFDGFLGRYGNSDFWLDTAADTAEAFIRRLSMFKLRSNVTLSIIPEAKIHALPATTQPVVELLQRGDTNITDGGAIIYRDPRHPELGYRYISDSGSLPSLPVMSPEIYETTRIFLGIPEAGKELVADKALPMEFHFEALGGVDFKKGCYVGQEVMARMKYRGTLRRTLYCVEATDAALPDYGSEIMSGEKSIGTLLSHDGSRGLAYLRIDAIESEETVVTANGIAMTAALPDYCRKSKDDDSNIVAG